MSARPGALLPGIPPWPGFGLVVLAFGGDNCGTGTEGNNPLCHAGSAAVAILGPVAGGR